MAVTNRQRATLAWLAIAIISFTAGWSQAAVLPEDRADILYHGYDGGDAEIDGPSILVRKDIKNTVSVYGNYYVDMVTSASIDVQATASPYTEERTEYSLGADYLYNKTIMSLVYSSSSENDYDSSTVGFGISQDFFGDLTNLSIGFSVGSDTVGNNADDAFEEDVDRRRYSFSLSQVLTKDLLVGLNVESAIDEGFLNNPYRSVRFVDPSNPLGYSYEAELYPSTRNSDAASIRAMYYLPYRASIHGEYRTYTDSWGIDAQTMEVGYTHPFSDDLILEIKYRRYEQTGAEFYSDLFAFREATTFRARDKELSDFSDQSIGFGVSYYLPDNWIQSINKGLDKSSINLYWDFFQFDYDNFRDVTAEGFTPGEEPLYSFDANVIRLFFSVWY